MNKPNMSQQKTAIPEQEPKIRGKNFDEVALGYDEEMALNEAARCLNCKTKPCIEGCPVNVQIPDFISLIKEKDYKGAYEKIKETNSLPAVCGRVCPQESQCEAKCIRANKGESVGIGRLERFAADWYIKNINEKTAKESKKNGHKVAVIGSGPAGLTCAGDLSQMGYDVTIYEAFHKGGGVLVYGIPEFRLPKAIVQAEIDALIDAGVKLETNVLGGKVISIEELFEEGYEAVFIGTGAGLPMFMNIPGENYNGVFSANEFLTRINLMKAYREEYDTPIMQFKNIAIVGGGNVAMDSARCALRLGAENVYIVYRRSEVEMPARKEEVHHAKEEGIIFKTLCNPTEIIGDDKGYVKGMNCVEMELGEPDASGRRRPMIKEGSEFTLEVDAVVMAIGTSPNPIMKNTTQGLEVNKKGCIVADEKSGATSIPGVFAGGDAVTGAATVIMAMGAGKQAATAIDEYIRSKNAN